MKFIRKPKEIGTLSSGACIVLDGGGGGCNVCYGPAPGYVPGPYKNSSPVIIDTKKSKNEK